MSLLDLFQPVPRPTSPARLVTFEVPEDNASPRELCALAYRLAWYERKDKQEKR